MHPHDDDDDLTDLRSLPKDMSPPAALSDNSELLLAMIVRSGSRTNLPLRRTWTSGGPAPSYCA